MTVLIQDPHSEAPVVCNQARVHSSQITLPCKGCVGPFLLTLLPTIIPVLVSGTNDENIILIGYC